MKKKTAVVTGAYRGIGFQVAKELAQKGFHVFLTARKQVEGQKAARELVDKGLSAEFVSMDVADAKSVKAAAVVVSLSTDRLDVLVNNAAVYPDPSGAVLSTSKELLMLAFETNAVGPLLAAQAFAPLLLKSASPRIINVTSNAGTLSAPQTFAPAYSVSKTALNSVTNQLAAALKNKVAVNAVCPGWVRTEMGGADAPRSVEEGADTIVWLATEAPFSLSGRVIRDRKPIDW